MASVRTRLVATKSIAETLRTLQVADGITWVSLGRARQSSRQLSVLVTRLGEMTPETVNRMRSIAGARSRYLLLAGGLPLEAVSERLAVLGVRDPERLHIAHERGAELEALLSRLASTLHERNVHLILDAWWEAEELVLLSHRFRRLRVPLADLRTVRGLTEVRRDQFERFELHPDGAYLHWPAPDVHMSWDQFERVANPDFRRDRGDAFHRSYGAAIRRIREASGLRQADVKGLTARHLRRIELGEQPATHSALAKLAKAHRMRVAEYVAAVARAATRAD